MSRSKIEWTDRTWNPVRGCSRVSEGCRHCYAERQASRFVRPGDPFHGFAEDGKWTGRVDLIPEKLAEPLSWRKPSRVFVNSMSDLFHESLPDEAIDSVFAVMALASHHTFQVLTKRPERMRKWFDRDGWRADEIPVPGARQYIYADREGDRLHVPRIEPSEYRWPLPNVWLGVSVEDQETADERIPLLLSTPAAVRFVSAEPLLGPIDFTRIAVRIENPRPDLGDPTHASALWDHDGHTEALDWVIVGGESGPGAGPCDVASVRSIVAQCRDSGTRCFVKQLGARPFQCEGQGACNASGDDPGGCRVRGGNCHFPLRDRKGGDPSEWPEDLRVREFPERTR